MINIAKMAKLGYTKEQIDMAEELFADMGCGTQIVGIPQWLIDARATEKAPNDYWAKRLADLQEIDLDKFRRDFDAIKYDRKDLKADLLAIKEAMQTRI